MADFITVRILVFLLAFFVLRHFMIQMIPDAKRWHGLAVIGVASLIAFTIGALVLEDPLGDTLVAWAVIYLVIAVIMFVRWRVLDNEKTWRRRDPEPAADQPDGEG